jgi:hypothetical protein
MSPDTLARMQEIFEAAVDLAPSEGPVYLSEACGDDVRLRDQVERLIQIDDVTQTVGGPCSQTSQQALQVSHLGISEATGCLLLASNRNIRNTADA